MNPEEEKMFFMCLAALLSLCLLKKIKACMGFLFNSSKTAGWGGGGGVKIIKF